MTHSKYTIKGIGAATLDRGISLVIAGTVLGGVITGISWLYDTQKKEEFLTDINIFSTGIKSYFYNADAYNITSLETIQNAGHLPEYKRLNEIAGYSITASDAVSLLTTYGVTDISKAFSLRIEYLPYKICVTTGQEALKDIVGVYGSTSSSLYLAQDLPVKDSSKLADWEAFCQANDKANEIGFIFK